MLFDTIAAISTPRGEGGIGIVRISGNNALEILGKIFKSLRRAAFRQSTQRISASDSGDKKAIILIKCLL